MRSSAPLVLSTKVNTKHNKSQNPHNPDTPISRPGSPEYWLEAGAASNILTLTHPTKDFQNLFVTSSMFTSSMWISGIDLVCVPNYEYFFFPSDTLFAPCMNLDCLELFFLPAVLDSVVTGNKSFFFHPCVT